MEGFLKYKTLLYVSSLICSLIKGVWGWTAYKKWGIDCFIYILLQINSFN